MYKEFLTELATIEAEPKERKTAEEILRKFVTIHTFGDINATKVSILQAMEEYNSQPLKHLTDDQIKKYLKKEQCLEEGTWFRVCTQVAQWVRDYYEGKIKA
jgi:hypothetical protein